MEDVVARTNSIPPPLPPKTRNRTQQLSNSSNSSSSSGEILTTFTFPEMRSVNLVSSAQQQQQAQQQGHVVKIRINPDQETVDYAPTDGCIRISVNGTSAHHETVIDTSAGGGDEGILRRSSSEKATATVVATSTPDRASAAPYYFYNSFPSASMVISSGQSSPSDTLDSGTCSDLDGSTPPPLPKKTSAASPPPPRPTATINTSATSGGSSLTGNTVTVTVNGGVSAGSAALTTFHQRNGSLTSSGAEVDSEDEEVDDDRISCDSLNSRELSSLSITSGIANNDSGIILSLPASVDKITVNAQEASASLTDSGIERDQLQPSVSSMPVATSPPPPPPPPLTASSSVAVVLPAAPPPPAKLQRPEGGCILPQSLLNDIRERSAKLVSVANGASIMSNGSGSLKKKLTRTWKDTPPTVTEEKPKETPAVQPKLKPLSIVPIYDDSTLEKKTPLAATPEAEESESDGVNQQVDQQQPPPVPKKPTPNHAQQNGIDQKMGVVTKNIVIVERNSPPEAKKTQCVVQERTYEDRKKEWDEKQQQLARQQQLAAVRGAFKYEADRFYNFHLNEHAPDDSVITPTSPTTPTSRRGSIGSTCSSILLQDDGLPDAEETFAGLKNISASSTIRSAKGTVRGVKNRVRAGIATFLQIQDTKSYKEKEAGKVVVYTTTMGVVRETHQACLKVRNILRTLLVRCEERDVFMSREVQTELRERMRSAAVVVPQVFVDGQHLGDAETIERLNESGELRRIMKPFKDPTVCHTCQVCGGFRLLPCSVCNGSKKSMHRNHFTSEFVALKCMHCDEVGLVRCYACS